MKRHFTNAVCMPIEPFATALGPLATCDIQWSDVLITTLIEVEEMLRIHCELFFINKNTQPLLTSERISKNYYVGFK